MPGPTAEIDSCRTPRAQRVGELWREASAEDKEPFNSLVRPAALCSVRRAAASLHGRATARRRCAADGLPTAFPAVAGAPRPYGPVRSPLCPRPVLVPVPSRVRAHRRRLTRNATLRRRRRRWDPQKPSRRPRVCRRASGNGGAGGDLPRLLARRGLRKRRLGLTWRYFCSEGGFIGGGGGGGSGRRAACCRHGIGQRRADLRGATSPPTPLPQSKWFAWCGDYAMYGGLE